jgi:hypothetical protein
MAQTVPVHPGTSASPSCCGPSEGKERHEVVSNRGNGGGSHSSGETAWPAHARGVGAYRNEAKIVELGRHLQRSGGGTLNVEAELEVASGKVHNLTGKKLTMKWVP